MASSYFPLSQEITDNKPQ